MMERTRTLFDRTKPITERYQRCTEVIGEIREEKPIGWKSLEEILLDVLDMLWDDMTPEQRSGFKSPQQFAS